MLDFMDVAIRRPRKGLVEIYPVFIIRPSSDLMTRGGDFYAIWNEETKLWSTDEFDAIKLIDRELDIFRSNYKGDPDDQIHVLYLKYSNNGMIVSWHNYVKKHLRASYHQLDEELTFSNTELTKESYASKKLPYPLEKTETKAYDELMSVLYSPEERHKIEWAVGAIVAGESKHVQKFVVMYGAPKTGKSTVLNIIQELFKGYYSVFDSKALGSSSNSFALEAFASNPLVAIQHDGDLSRIEDNTRLNSLVSHESMMVNEKFKSAYQNKFNCFLFMGSNKPVKITDAKSGIIRRLIDVSPSGNKLEKSDYDRVMNAIRFELGGIAYHCREVYLENPGAYDDYIPMTMMSATNDFYNYVLYYYDKFIELEGISLQSAWDMYNKYNEKANVPKAYSMRVFKEELKNYFDIYEYRHTLEDGTRVRQYYSGFNTNKFNSEQEVTKKTFEVPKLSLECTKSLLDDFLADCPAQYAKEDDTPEMGWDYVHTDLIDIDTTRVHYVRPPENFIVIDFDLKDENGNKSFELNSIAAAKWPQTYAELSKGGQGIHLHYIYSGDITKLAPIYEKDIEVKVFKGKSALRRRLSKCNDIPIATISSGLPLVKEEKVVNKEVIVNEDKLRACIKKALRKDIESIPASTKCSMDFINYILNNAYDSGITYNVEDMREDITYFAMHSSHQAEYCMKLAQNLKYKSEEEIQAVPDDDDDAIYIFDIEVAPNLLIIVYKRYGEQYKWVSLINPEPEIVEDILNKKLVGYNCRRYDNHILYARAFLQESLKELYDRSYKIISKDNSAFIGNAYNVSYTDIYDYCKIKQSLKKWEIDLGIHHQEAGIRWDQPVPEDRWQELTDYCVNDVLATEAVFKATQGDFQARKILAALSGLTVNDTTNSHTTRLIFGTEKRPQHEFRYRNLAEPVIEMDPEMYNFLNKNFPEMTRHKHNGHGKGIYSLLPYFPGYKYDNGKSTYRGMTVGEGGFVWATPGMYGRVITFDVASMHPHSATSEYLFGKYTEQFNDLMETRIDIKHKDFDAAKKLFDGKLEPYLNDPAMAKDLAGALKIAINSVYGLTAAGFENPFKDPRNIDNIVAKRGALFMIDLLNAVKERGGQVIHIKTDSIKIADPTPELQEFVMDFGKSYGYTFEIEHIFEKICLVNNAVYIAKLAEDDPEDPGKWTATGAEFAEPFIFKYLFSKEDIVLKDYCQTKSVTDPAALYLDFNENMGENEHNYVFVGKVGSFVPIKPGCGGGVLLREKEGKYDSATGCKGYRWKEAEVVKERGYDDQIDTGYFIAKANDAVADLEKVMNTKTSTFKGSIDEFMER